MSSIPMTEEKAPSDRLYESGCTLCGNARWSATDPGLMNFGPCYDNPEGLFCCVCWRAFGGNDGVDAEITRRKSLRSPPSPPSEGKFKVGDEVEWDVDGLHETGRIAEITRHNIIVERLTSSLGYTGWARFDPETKALRRLTPAASPDKWEPKVGEEIEGESFVGRHVRRGRFAEFTEGTAGLFARLDDGEYLHRETIRPAASPERKAATSHIEAALAKAGKVTIAKPDPYTTTPHGLHEWQIADVMAARGATVPMPNHRPPNAHDLRVAAARLAREARYERRKAETVEAFDRPLATVAVGGRFGRRVPLPGRWALAEDDEP